MRTFPQMMRKILRKRKKPQKAEEHIPGFIAHQELLGSEQMFNSILVNLRLPGA